MMMLMLLPAPSSGNISCVDRPFFRNYIYFWTGCWALGAFLFQNGRYWWLATKSSIADLKGSLLHPLLGRGLHPFVIDHDSGKLQYYTGNLRGWAGETRKGNQALPDIELERESSILSDDDDDHDRRRLLESIYGKASLIYKSSQYHLSTTQ